MNRRFLIYTLFCCLPVLTILRADAQSTVPSAAHDPLFQSIAARDKLLFDAYNTCDLKTLGGMVSDDLEFYHDKTGLAVGRATFLDSIQKNICGKVTRELLPATLEVFPLAGYGAVEIGIHRIHHPGERNNEGIGEAKFITLWRNNGGTWIVTRVISYDHASAALKADAKPL